MANLVPQHHIRQATIVDGSILSNLSSNPFIKCAAITDVKNYFELILCPTVASAKPALTAGFASVME